MADPFQDGTEFDSAARVPECVASEDVATAVDEGEAEFLGAPPPTGGDDGADPDSCQQQEGVGGELQQEQQHHHLPVDGGFPGGYNNAADDVDDEHFPSSTTTNNHLLDQNESDDGDDDNADTSENNGGKTPEDSGMLSQFDTQYHEGPRINGGCGGTTTTGDDLLLLVSGNNDNTADLIGLDDNRFTTTSEVIKDEVIEEDEVMSKDSPPADFDETSEATPPPSPPPSPQSAAMNVQQPEPFIYDHPSPAADTTTAASGDGPVKMPKATTISPPTKTIRSNSSGSVTACMKALDPRVCEVLLWRDPKVTAPVLAALLVILIALGRCSIVSVVSYLLLITLILTTITRVGKYVLSKVHTADEDHPFKSVLDADLLLSEEVAADYAQAFVHRLNPILGAIRDWTLVKEYINSIKFGFVLYTLTWIGAWFNGLTLAIIATVAAFTLPKVYEVNRSQVDQYVDMAQAKFDDLYKQLQDKVPYLKKQKTQ